MKYIRNIAAVILLAASAGAAAGSCTSNKDGVYTCSHIDLIGSLTLDEMGGDSHANDMWGWTDPLDGKEYVIVGLRDGTAFVDISDPEHPRYLGRLDAPPESPPAEKSSPPLAAKCHDGCGSQGGEEENSTWSDVKTYGHHVYIVSEQDWHGMLVFDLHRLRGVTTPQTFTPTTHVTGFRDAHNLFINEETGFAYVIGNNKPDSDDPDAEPNFGGLLVFDLSDPANPVEVADYETDEYFHDVVCVNYHGPDVDYQGREICFASNSGSRRDMDPDSPNYGTMLYYNEHSDSFRSDWKFVDPTEGMSPDPSTDDHFVWPDTAATYRPFIRDRYARLTVLDVTDKDNIVHLSHDQHPDSSYVHQAWPSEDHRYLFVNDEKDETAYGSRTRSYTYDLTDLDAIDHVATYTSPDLAIDHNEYVNGRLLFQSNYDSGLRILDASDPVNLVEVGFFDSQPDTDFPQFWGTWSNYPYFESGIIAFSDMYSGLFLVRPYLEESSELGSEIAVTAALQDGAADDHTYYFAVANNGPGVAEEIDVTLHLPQGQTFAGILDNAGATCTTADRKVVCQIASLASCTAGLFALSLDVATPADTEIIGMAAARQLDMPGNGADNIVALPVSAKQAKVDTEALQASLVGAACSSVPTIDAGEDRSVTAGEVVNLAALAADAHAPIVAYRWEQTAGTAVSLTATDTAATSFSAPSVGEATDLEFEVTVTNAYGKTGSDRVSVEITAKSTSDDDDDDNGGGGGALSWLLLSIGLLSLRCRKRRN
ncbi:MAG TPA: choice-of-anchor B family protein [Gammaproteobacteria bacterium]